MAPKAPTSCLPPLARLSECTPAQLDYALNGLKAIYWPSPIPSALKLSALKHANVAKLDFKKVPVPDSGYASAEEEDENQDEGSDGEDIDLDTIRADPLERAFAIKWLTGFLSRSDDWCSTSDVESEEGNTYREVVQVQELATRLLSRFSTSAEDEQEESLNVTRTFSFPTPGAEPIQVVLNDAPLETSDHTSVGLQSWGSCIILAEMMCADPHRFCLGGFLPPPIASKRVLELGAGTGMLSIVAAKLLTPNAPGSTIIATDYHPLVLENLRANISTHFPMFCSNENTNTVVHVQPLDWSSPYLDYSPLSEPFDILLAADVIYDPAHARWLNGVAKATLSRDNPDARFWLIVPRRIAGRLAGVETSVDEIFSWADTSVFNPSGMGRTRDELIIINMQDINKVNGIGRVDEGGYRLFEIGWGS
jgi:protein-lysine N-methyltransferase EEF2KMT